MLQSVEIIKLLHRNIRKMIIQLMTNFKNYLFLDIAQLFFRSGFIH